MTRFRPISGRELTSVSGSDRRPEALADCNPVKPRRSPPVAWRLLQGIVMVARSAVWLAAPVLLTGCPIPPPLETDERPDAAPNSPPVILSASPDEFAIPGPILLERGDQRRLTLTVHDNNVGDTSYVYFYRDYLQDKPTPSLAECRSTEPTVQRLVDCGTSTLCAGLSDTDKTEFFLEAIVADAEKLGEGEPAFRAFPKGVNFTRVAWVMSCLPAQ